MHVGYNVAFQNPDNRSTDEAVYAAKRCGRNCVQIAAPTPVAA